MTVPLRFVTDPLQILYSSLTVPLRLVTPYYASVTAPRLRVPGEKKNSNAYNQRKPRPSPKRGAGGAAPAGGTACPPVSKTLEGGPGGTTAQAKPVPPLKEGASHNKAPSVSQSRGQGAQPPPGVQRVPLFPKTLEGGPGGTTAQAKPIPPLKEGASHNNPPFPKRGAGGAAPTGGTACPPVSKNVGGWAGGTTAPAKPDPPLKEGASHNKPPFSKQGAGGAAPAGGTGGVPLYPKRWRVGRWDNGARHRQPPAEQNAHPEPQRRLGGGFGAAPAGLTPF